MGAPDSLIDPGMIERMCGLAARTPPGCFVEVGVYRGGSAWHLLQLATQQGRELHLFDTFSGIPMSGQFDMHVVGDFGDVNLVAVQDALEGAHFHIGVFPGTLHESLREIAFVHADCDQYESVRSVIEHLEPRLVPGGIIWFDDVDCLPGATRAAEELLGGRLIREPAFKPYYVKS